MNPLIVPVRTGKPYNVEIAPGLLAQAGRKIGALQAGRRIAVVTDDLVCSYYGTKLDLALGAAGYAPERFTFPAGEASKTPATYVKILNFLADVHLTRSDLVIALGGGVTGDLAGFAAATYLRGVRFVQIPTTLLAMVDSSVGGKTGVDLEAGKNLAGAFHQPSMVLCDPELLNTLPAENWADGAAEAVKSAMLADPALFALLETGNWHDRAGEVIAGCVKIKSQVVAEDEFDRGTRQLLNFGHTLGHAVEKATHYRISHGHAVAIGMAAVTRSAVARNLTTRSVGFRLEAALQANHLPTELPLPLATLLPLIAGDKKRSGDRITLVVPEVVGRCRLLPMTLDEAMEFFRAGQGTAEGSAACRG